jgi:hypothetical protein
MAIITDDFRRTSAELFHSDLKADSSSVTTAYEYYVGIGKSDPYYDDENESEDNAAFDGVANPRAGKIYQKEVLENLSTVIKVVEGASAESYRVIPRYNFVAASTEARKYKVYDPNDEACFEAGGGFQPCIVMNAKRQLYICIRNSDDSGTVSTMTQAEIDDMEQGVTAGGRFSSLTDSDGDSNHEEVDGILNPNDGDYLFAYVCQIDNTSGFYTPNYVAVTNTDYSSLDSDENNPVDATGGLFYGFSIENGGSGYGQGSDSDAYPHVIVTGRRTDGSTFKWDSNTTSGDFIDINVNSSGVIDYVGVDKNAVLDRGSLSDERDSFLDIVYATVHVIDEDAGTGTGAIVKPMIAPLEGFGGDNLNLLPSYFVGIKAQFEETMDGDAIINTITNPYTFRQVSLIRGWKAGANGITIDTSQAATENNNTSADCHRFLVKASGNTPETGDIIWQNLSGSSSSSALALENGDPVAIVDYYDSTNSRVYYHQNANDFAVNSNYTMREFHATTAFYIKNAADDTSDSVTPNAIGTGEYYPYVQSNVLTAGRNTRINQNTTVPYSSGVFTSFPTSSPANTTEYSFPVIQNGDVIFVENRAAVTRSTDQTEEIRIVIQF